MESIHQPQHQTDQANTAAVTRERLHVSFMPPGTGKTPSDFLETNCSSLQAGSTQTPVSPSARTQKRGDSGGKAARREGARSLGGAECGGGWRRALGSGSAPALAGAARAAHKSRGRASAPRWRLRPGRWGTVGDREEPRVAGRALPTPGSLQRQRLHGCCAPRWPDAPLQLHPEAGGNRSLTPLRAPNRPCAEPGGSSTPKRLRYEPGGAGTPNVPHSVICGGLTRRDLCPEAYSYPELLHPKAGGCCDSKHPCAWSGRTTSRWITLCRWKQS